MTEPESLGRVDARRNRERVLQAALEVFSREGLVAEVQEIGHRAGVGMGTIYRNFGSKEGLIEALKQELERDALVVVTDASAESDPLTALQVLLRGVFALAETYGAIGQMVRATGVELKHGGVPHAEAEMLGLLRRALEAGVVRMEFTPEFLFAWLRSLVMVYVELRKSMSADEVAGMCGEAFLRGTLA